MSRTVLIVVWTVEFYRKFTRQGKRDLLLSLKPKFWLGEPATVHKFFERRLQKELMISTGAQLV